ncbi:MAG: hypothetical protein ACFFCW_30720 [Candidatus Hodarchaeota archaeon]
MDAKKLAVLFHNTYEELAPRFGYTTREDTRELDLNSPNGHLMIAVCGEILREINREIDNQQFDQD